jgi:hypothetical protein
VGNSRKSIKQTVPALARPRRADYLLMTKSAAASLNDTEDEYGIRTDDVSNMIDFQRALEIIGRQNTAKKQRLSPLPGEKETQPTWQSTAISSFTEADKWVFGGQLQKKWPYTKGLASANHCQMTVVYPDVFCDVGFEEEKYANIQERSGGEARWVNDIVPGKQQGGIFAVLPLLEVMGAVVSTHLHSGVTHILCEMKSKKKILKWTSTLPRSVFANPEAGSLLHERLLSLEESAALSTRKWGDVMLVSPEWVEETWNA